MLSQVDQDRAEYLLYEEKVRRLSEKNFRNNYVAYKELRGQDFELDHKLSIKDGFAQDIPIELMSDPLNLEIMPKCVNRMKGKRSSITYNELIELITERDSEY